MGDCPFCHRVLLTLQYKGIPFKKEYIDLSAPRPQWLLDISGGKVPVLKIGTSDVGEHFLLPDSDKIVVYLEEKFPEPSMLSSAPQGMTSKIFPAFRQYLAAGSPEELETKKAQLLAELVAINEYLSAPGKGPLFGGLHLDAEDAAFAPKLYHILVACQPKGFVLPLELAALWRYMGFVQTLPAWQDVDYGSLKILEGWSKKH
ncbi:hypothetical protein CEUSTIGMA_g3714.t1 [Chlamydomonas eustigma]|uniref:GST N-terminal domain-containing protein n=1 Tax=Chlamydomonas eustigma TaxID=1157962 RepID=A0A250X0I5_9CHLO|nr:hypothetical protein CEUSTIGMA_g3714.t1 [Chlamydomonas eustigma]|eukprot:GAX76270.1 hypothetical protein CEUSTIGMA_g3714.t1 [Chlamydomonas eustigma]